MSLTLPTSKIPAVSENPRYLILYGLPKAGKTSCLAQLDNNLIIDLEGGSVFVDAMAIQCRTIDNATRLEDICMSYACTLYRQTPMGKKWDGTDVTTLPNGAGYKYLRDAVKKVVDMFRDLCDEFILVGHVKDTVTEKDGVEVSAKELDLVGKLSKIVCGLADAVGYVYRKGNETHISFKGGTSDTIMEARARHIAGKDIVIAEGNEDGTLTTHWDRIFK